MAGIAFGAMVVLLPALIDAQPHPLDMNGCQCSSECAQNPDMMNWFTCSTTCPSGMGGHGVCRWGDGQTDKDWFDDWWLDVEPMQMQKMTNIAVKVGQWSEHNIQKIPTEVIELLRGDVICEFHQDKISSFTLQQFEAVNVNLLISDCSWKLEGLASEWGRFSSSQLEKLASMPLDKWNELVDAISIHDLRLIDNTMQGKLDSEKLKKLHEKIDHTSQPTSQPGRLCERWKENYHTRAVHIKQHRGLDLEACKQKATEYGWKGFNFMKDVSQTHDRQLLCGEIPGNLDPVNVEWNEQNNGWDVYRCEVPLV